MVSQITALPTPPSRQDPENFSARGDAFLSALPGFVSETNNLATELNGLVQNFGYAATSVTSNTVDTSGPKTFVVQPGLSYAAGQFVLAANTAAPENYIVGQITSYDDETGELVLSILKSAGAGTYVDWSLSLTLSVAEANFITAEADRAEAAASAAAASGEVYDSSADALSNGVKTVTITAAGSGGTDGIYQVPITGSSGTNGRIQIVISGNVLTEAYVLTHGENYTGSLVADIDSIAGTTGASVSLTSAPNKSPGEYFLAVASDGIGFLDLWRVDAGPIATYVGLTLPSASDLAAEVVRLTEIIARVRTGQGARDASGGYVYRILDALNKVGFALFEDGEAWLNGIRTSVDIQHRDSQIVVFPIRDSKGKLAFGITEEGGILINDLVQSDNARSQYRDASPYIWRLADRNRKIALGLRSDGGFYFQPSAELLLDMQTLLYSSPADFGVPYNTFNIRNFTGYKIASTNDFDGMTFDVRRNEDSVDDTAVAEGVGPINFVGVMGQSNAGPSGDGLVTYNDAPYPHHALRFSTMIGAGGSNAVADDQFFDFKPAASTINPTHWVATLANMALEHITRIVSGRPSSASVEFSSFYGGQPISTFIRGTQCWDNLMTAARGVVRSAEKYGREVDCRFVTFIQGESASPDYKAAIESFSQDLIGELQLQMDLANPPEFVLLQINSNDIASVSSGIELDQLEFAMEDLANNVTMAGPMYDAPLGSDLIHQSEIGRMIIGERLAACYDVILSGQKFSPLWPLSVTRTDNIIDIVFNVPGAPITFDTDWMMPPVPNQGFVYRDDSDSANIVAVSIIADDTVRVELDVSPVGANPILEYAIITESESDQWASGRGQIYSDSQLKSFFFQRGYAVPETIRHYAVRFSQEI